MSELNKLDRSVYKAIVELTKISPDGELTYTKILTCYLNGNTNKSIPWAAIQKSKIYGKVPKANPVSVMMACNNLVSLGFLTRVKVSGNFKYFLTFSKPKDESKLKSFSEKLTKYQCYLLEQFNSFILKSCSSLMGVEHENYYGFVNKNPIHFNEYNWFWVTNELQKPHSLKVQVRYRPNLKRAALTFSLSQKTFIDVVNQIIEVLKDEKSKYKLTIFNGVEYPVLRGPVINTKGPDSNPELSDIDLSFLNDNLNVLFNNGDEASVNAALCTSESSPYKYAGDTKFAPKDLKTMVQKNNSFDFSFVKWKVAAWTVASDEPSSIQNALLISKKTKKIWVVVSIPRRKVICVTSSPFELKTNQGILPSDKIIDCVFKK